MKSLTLSLTSISHFVNDGNTFILPVLYAYLLSQLGIEKVLVGVLGSMFFLLSALASPLVSYIGDRSGSPLRVMGVGILLWGVGLISLGLSLDAKDLLGIFIAVSISGLSSAFYHPLGASALSLVFEGNAGSALGINGSLGSVGRALYPSLTLFLFDLLGKGLGSISETLVILGLVSLLSGLPPFFIGHRIVPYGKQNEKVNPKTSHSVASGFMKVVLILTAISFVRSVFTQGISQFLPSILEVTLHQSYGIGLGVDVTAVLASAILGQPLLGLLSDRYGRRLLFGISNAGAVASILAFTYSGSFPFLVLFGFFTYSNFPLTLSLVGDLVPRSSTGVSNALVWGLGISGGGVIGPSLFGVLYQFLGVSEAIYLVTILGLLSVLLVPLIPKPSKRSRVPLFG